MYFDGTANMHGNGVGAVIVSPEGRQFPTAVKLEFECTNNIAEYEACVNGLQAAISMGIRSLEVFGDSALIIYQVKGEWQTKDAKLMPYQEYLVHLIEQFDEINFHHFNRDKNQFADALATLAAMIRLDCGVQIQPIQIESQKAPAYCLNIEEGSDDHPWFIDIKNYLKDQV